MSPFRRRPNTGDSPQCVCPECADLAHGFSAEQAEQRMIDRMQSLMHEHGVAIQHVLGSPTELPFSYTIGLFLHGLPEFITFGAPPEVSSAILNHLAIATRDHGTQIEAGDTIEYLLERLPAAVLSVDDPGEHLCMAFAIRNREVTNRVPIRALQIVLPDAKGLMPWQRGYHGIKTPLLTNDIWPTGPTVFMPDLR